MHRLYYYLFFLINYFLSFKQLDYYYYSLKQLDHDCINFHPNYLENKDWYLKVFCSMLLNPINIHLENTMHHLHISSYYLSQI